MTGRHDCIHCSFCGARGGEVDRIIASTGGLTRPSYPTVFSATPACGFCGPLPTPVPVLKREGPTFPITEFG
jgi:thiamine pyrophosphokinase